MKLATVGSMILATTPVWAQTGFIRQFAKDKSSVYFVSSGLQSKLVAYELYKQVRASPEFQVGERAVRLLNISDLQSLISRRQGPGSETVVFVLEKDELADLPSFIAHAAEVEADVLSGGKSHIIAKQVRPADQGLSFTVLLTAPDNVQLQKLSKEFIGSNFGNWRYMNVNETYQTKNVVVHVPKGMEKTLATWGYMGYKNVWETRTYLPLDAPNPNPNADEAFIINRSIASPGIPERATSLIPSDLPDNALFAKSAKTPNGHSIAVITAPDSIFLNNLTSAYTNVDKVPDKGYTRKVVDMRNLGTTTILSGGTAVADNDGLRTTVRKLIADRLPIDIRETAANFRGAWNVTLDGLKEDGALRAEVKRRTGSRYLWYLDAKSGGANTSYHATVEQLTGGRQYFTEGEPSKPVHAEGTKKEDWDRQVAQYNSDVESWKQRKNDYEWCTAVQWRLTLTHTSTANATLNLYLIDLDKKEDPIVWSEGLNGSSSESGTDRSEEVTISGHMNSASAYSEPSSDGNCTPQLYDQAVQSAVDSIPGYLRWGAWFDWSKKH